MLTKHSNVTFWYVEIVEYFYYSPVFFFFFFFYKPFRFNEFSIMFYFRGKGPITRLYRRHRAQMFLRNCIGIRLLEIRRSCAIGGRRKFPGFGKVCNCKSWEDHYICTQFRVINIYSAAVVFRVNCSLKVVHWLITLKLTRSISIQIYLIFLAIRLFNLTKYLTIMINYNINIGVIDDILLFESVIINLTILRKCNEIFLTSDQRWSFVKRRNWTLSVFFFFFLLLSIYGFSNILLSPSELSSQVLMWIMNKSI